MQPKAMLRRLLAAGGLEVHRYDPSRSQPRFSQAGALRQLARLGFVPSTVIDVGAGNGTAPLYQIFPKAHHVLIEPLEEFAPALHRLVSGLDTATFVAAAAGPDVESVTINVHPDLFGSSVLVEPEDTDVNGLPRVVNQVTLDEVAEQYRLTGPYLLKADVQGYELAVLDGARQRVLPETEAILLEASLFSFFDGGPDFASLIARLAELGYSAYDFMETSYRPLDGAMAQIDVLFVRTSGPFRRHHHFATQAQRKDQQRRLTGRRSPSSSG